MNFAASRPRLGEQSHRSTAQGWGPHMLIGISRTALVIRKRDTTAQPGHPLLAAHRLLHAMGCCRTKQEMPSFVHTKPAHPEHSGCRDWG